MNCELVFYLSSKTHLCENALRKSLGSTEIKLRTARFATVPEKLGEIIIDALEKTNIVFIVGGLRFNDENSAESIMSRALAGKTLDDLKKLKNPLSSSDGYLIRRGGQLIVLLPDEPEEIEALMSGEIKGYLREFSSL